jgi:hypothetical protein
LEYKLSEREEKLRQDEIKLRQDQQFQAIVEDGLKLRKEVELLV